jgi:uncharacterized cofD-like protein
MMEQYTGDFITAVDGLRALLGCEGKVWPVTVERATLCAEYADGTSTRGEVEIDAGQASGRAVERLWLDPPVSVHHSVADAIRSLDAAVIGPGSFYTSLLPIFLVDGVREALAAVPGPIIYVANLLTEGRGMDGFTAADAVRRLREAIGRSVDVAIVNVKAPSAAALDRYAAERKHPLPPGDLPAECEVVEGEFWRRPIARHDRRRLRSAVWAILADRLLMNGAPGAR